MHATSRSALFCFTLCGGFALWPGIGLGAAPPSARPGAAAGVARSSTGLPLRDTGAAAIVVDTLPQAPDAAIVAEALQHYEAHNLVGAEALLTPLHSPASHLLRARIANTAGNFDAADVSLRQARAAPVLQPLIALEAGRAAWGRRDGRAAVAILMPLFDGGGALATAAAPILLSALAVSDPARLLRLLPNLAALLPRDDADAQSAMFEAKAVAQTALGQTAAAEATRLERFLQAPLSASTPSTPPAGSMPTPRQWLRRIEALLAANRNGRAAEALRDFDAQFPEATLAGDTALLCQKYMADGIAARKLHRYQAAERALGWVQTHCQDADLVRRAHYLGAKVISIQDGLRAIAAIEAFAKAYPDHSMTDDVLFWAGDIYQRRGRSEEARAYYERIETLPHFDDQCSDARWRLAWMAYRRGDRAAAEAGLQRILTPDGCSISVSNRARALYWLGRVTEANGNTAGAIGHYRNLWAVEPLGFYAQQALPRLQALLPAPQRDQLQAQLTVPTAAGTAALCPGDLAEKPAFRAGLAYLAAGLGSDAAAAFKTLATPVATVISESQATSQGVAMRRPPQHTADSLSRCGPSQSALLLVLLLDRAGAHRDAHWRLRTEFDATLAHLPSAAEVRVWRAAYPLAYRDRIAAAEQEAQIPAYFLQALAREESAFNPFVVSWAEAYGLTQLLLSSGQAAGRLLKPPVRLRSAEELLEPRLNARLGGALVGAEAKKFSGHLALALAAYNAGDETTSAWAKKYAGQDLDIFAEEIGIQETRGYVQRVLKTFGIYRWLYAGAPPILAAAPVLP